MSKNTFILDFKPRSESYEEQIRRFKEELLRLAKMDEVVRARLPKPSPEPTPELPPHVRDLDLE